MTTKLSLTRRLTIKKQLSLNDTLLKSLNSNKINETKKNSNESLNAHTEEVEIKECPNNNNNNNNNGEPSEPQTTTISETSSNTISNTSRGNTLEKRISRVSSSSSNSGLYKNLNWTNFWDIKGYKPIIKRCDDGYVLSKNLMDCLHERAKINQEFAKSVAQWLKKWSNIVDTSEEQEYGSAKDAWLDIIQIEEEIVKINTELSIKYQEKSNTINNWLRENYQKHIIHFNQQKYFKEEFENAQKKWQKTIDKLNDFKKDYDTLVKKFGNDDSSIEIKAKKEHIKLNFESEYKLLEHYQPDYQKNMKIIFEESQQLERLRKKEFKKIFDIWLLSLKEQINNGFDFDNISSINKFDPEFDLKWYSDTYGPGMEFKLPKHLI